MSRPGGLRRGLARGPLLAGAALVLVVAVWKVVPWLTADRTVTASTPTEFPLNRQGRLPLPGGTTACIDQVTFEPGAQAAQLVVRTGRGPGPPLSLTAAAPGYRARGRVAGGYADGATVTIPFAAAGGERPDGRLCVRNDGRRAIGLLASVDPRDLTPVHVTIDGRRVVPQPSVRLVRERPASVLASAGTILDRVAAFRPVGSWLLWPLALLVLLGVPALVVVAVAAATRDDELEEQPRP